MMSRREVIERSLLGKKTDRMGCFPLVDLAYAASHVGELVSRLALEPAAHGRALRRCLEELPIDGVYINLCFATGQGSVIRRDDQGAILIVDGSIEVKLPDNDVPSISRSGIENLDDPRMETAELFHPGMLATFRAIQSGGEIDGAIVVGLTGAFSQVAFLYGLEKLMMAMMDEPENVQRAVEKRQQIALNQAKEICHAGGRFLWIGEGVASGSLISPEFYRRFVLPYERELAEKIRECGGLSILHICGDTTALLADIACCGADGYDLDWPVDLSRAMETLTGRMAIKGNINPVLFCDKDLSRLSEQCGRVRRLAATVPGFIMSTGCLVPRDGRRKAFSVMAEACGYAE